jgi:rhodanese-related sulfurtransferase
MMSSVKVPIDVLKRLEPLGSLSEARLGELAQLSRLESVGKNLNPFGVRRTAGQTVYLVRGEIALAYPDGTSVVLVGATDEARHPLGRRGGMFTEAKAITDIELLHIDDELLDITLTWDQLAANEVVPQAEAGLAHGAEPAKWSVMSGIFNVSNLQFGAFAQLPSAHIQELLKRFTHLEVRAGEIVISEGAEGDYYYIIESGKARVERMIGGVSIVLAERKSGDAFGEEALVSEVKRNATVSMRTSGSLLRLDKKDFIELLREPLLHRVSMDEARQKIAAGGQYIDVRYPSEYQYDRLPGAINIPLVEIRNAFGLLDKDRDYVVYCQSERRSAAAAFLLAQHGYRAHLLEGGLQGQDSERRAG